MSRRWLQNTVRVAIAGFLILSLLAVAGMWWQLWWRRDRLMYSGKSVTEQREAVFSHVGLDARLVRSTEQLAGSLPAALHYRSEGGDENQWSYLKYILAPRAQDPSAAVVLRVHDGVVEAAGGPFAMREGDRAGGVSGWHSHWGAGAVGWMISVLCVFGIGALVLRAIKAIKGLSLSVPEILCVGSLAAYLCGLLARAAVGTPLPGLILPGAMGLAIWIHGVWRQRGMARPPVPRMDSRADAVLAAAGFVVIGAAVLLAFMLSTCVVPDDWDAWATWGGKASVFGAGMVPLADVQHFGQPDYPLLWPALWTFGGMTDALDCWGRAWSALLYGLAVWQMGVVILRCTSRPRVAVLGAALFASVPKVTVIASWGYAEPALWLALTCLFGRIACRLKAANDAPDPATGHPWAEGLMWGLFAAAAVHTKNDGVLPVGLMIVTAVVVGWREWRIWLVASLVAALLYLPWVYWTRVVLHLGSHATHGLAVSPDRLHHAWGRLPAAVNAIRGVWGDWQQWSVVLVLLPCAVLAAAWMSRVARRLLIIPTFTLLGLSAIVLFHDTDVAWLVGSSWDRLTAQVLPLFILAVFCAIPTQKPT